MQGTCRHNAAGNDLFICQAANAGRLALTTVLTTTGPDKLPLYAILHSGHGQVSHGMPQPARSLQAEDHPAFLAYGT